MTTNVEIKDKESTAAGREHVPTVSPRCDISENAESVNLSAEMPGALESALEVSVERNVLTIGGPIAQRDDAGWERVHGALTRGRYHRAFQLSSEVDTQNIRADFRNGVLSLSLPKKKPARIEITVKSS